MRELPASHLGLKAPPAMSNTPTRSGASFALIYKQQQRRLTAIEMLKFFDWSYRAGTKLADELQYVPMPKDVVQMIESAWAEVTDAHGQPAWTEPTTAKH